MKRELTSLWSILRPHSHHPLPLTRVVTLLQPPNTFPPQNGWASVCKNQRTPRVNQYTLCVLTPLQLGLRPRSFTRLGLRPYHFLSLIYHEASSPTTLCIRPHLLSSLARSSALLLFLFSPCHHSSAPKAWKCKNLIKICLEISFCLLIIITLSVPKLTK